jgi:hypothetical protein
MGVILRLYQLRYKESNIDILNSKKYEVSREKAHDNGSDIPASQISGKWSVSNKKQNIFLQTLNIYVLL